MPRWTRSLFARVFAHGLLVLVATSATMVTLVVLLIHPKVERQFHDLGRLAAPALCGRLLHDDPPTAATGFRATAYSPQGKLLYTFHTPPLEPLSAADVARLQVVKEINRPNGRRIQAVWCDEVPGGAYVELGPHRIPSLGAHIPPLLMVILVVGLASIPFARSIARPIVKLVRVTQAFGRGELGARIDIRRTDEVGELARSFNQMAERLQRLIRADQELVANVSHELRTPLARIRVVLETAMENPRRAEGLLQEIDKDLGDLEGLVETILETMRLDMAKTSITGVALPARLAPMDMVAQVKAAAARFRGMYPDREVAIEVEGDRHDASGDVRLVRRLLDNLLDNSRKYSDADTRVLLRVRPEDAQVVVEVIDHGVGIDEADLQHVFEPFFRSACNRSRGVQGTGLGLSLAQQIVSAHGGQIAIASERGVGTTVRVSLPRS